MIFYIGERVICSESGVIGDIIKFYRPTASEEQIMVKTLDGRKYHAPARTWRPYQIDEAHQHPICKARLHYFNETGK